MLGLMITNGRGVFIFSLGIGISGRELDSGEDLVLVFFFIVVLFLDGIGVSTCFFLGWVIRFGRGFWRFRSFRRS